MDKVENRMEIDINDLSSGKSNFYRYLKNSLVSAREEVRKGLITVRKRCIDTCKDILSDFNLCAEIYRSRPTIKPENSRRFNYGREVELLANEVKRVYQNYRRILSDEELMNNSAKWKDRFVRKKYDGSGNPERRDLVYRGFREMTLPEIKQMLLEGVRPKVDSEDIEKKSTEEIIKRVNQHRAGIRTGDGIISATASKTAAIAYSKGSTFKINWRSLAFVHATYFPSIFRAYYFMLTDSLRALIKPPYIDLSDLDLSEITQLVEEKGLCINELKFNFIATINAPRNQRYGTEAPAYMVPSNQEASYIGTLSEITQIEITEFGYTDASGKFIKIKTY